jgi:ribonuclease J
MGIFIQSPAGNIVHTGDFKFDFNPADGVRADFGKLAEIGSKGIDVLFADSTNAQKPGFCVSESVVAKTLERVIRRTKGRLIIASFSSLIGRLQQIIDYATLYGRQIFVSGRSMIQNLEIASKLGYVKVPRGILKRMSNKVDDLPPEKVLILSTGSQGESMSALSRIALGNHPQIKIKKGDTVIFSSSPIPGNERATATVINNLFRLGAHVITNDAMDVHTSGHAHQGDLKLMYSLIRPKFVAPIHGEFFMRMAHVEMMQQEFGLDQNETIVLENGSILEIANKQARKSKKKAPANIIMVDGLGVGDVGTKVIRDRQVMAENGVVIALFRAFDKSKRLVADPDIISRGFIYMKESKNIADETKQKAKKAYEDAIKKKPNLGLKELKMEISRSLSTFIRKRLDREPMIMPVIVFV